MNAIPKILQGRVLVAGKANAEVLLLQEALSFWGGFDPQHGRIIDVHHPQAGLPVKGKILVISSSRGSAGTPACIAETLRNGSGPAAFILGSADVNICIGVSVANRLYGLDVPVIELSPETISTLNEVESIAISVDGSLQSN